GEIMLRVGQRYLAWSAFERAERMAEQFWPDVGVQQSFRKHCRRRQSEIQDDMAMNYRRDRPPDSDRTMLRSQFEADLAHGQEFQRPYQDYEAAKIAAGASIDDDHFYDEFNAGREPIATTPGTEEFITGVSQATWSRYRSREIFAWGLVAAGATAML